MLNSGSVELVDQEKSRKFNCQMNWDRNNEVVNVAALQAHQCNKINRNTQ